MRFTGFCKFLGAETRKGFKDPSKTFYVVGFGQGLDSLCCYVDAESYVRYSGIEPYSDIEAEFEYNPVSGKINLISIN